MLSRAVIEHPPTTAQLPPQVRDVGTDNAAIYAGPGPDRGDGADRGRAAGRPRVRGRSPAPVAQPGPDRGERRYAVPVAPGRPGLRSRARRRGRDRRRGARHRARVAPCPLLQSMSDTYFGPFQIRWGHVLGIAAFGLLSAFLAAVVPAWIASRQDVVAVLAGRRGDRAASRRSPYIGVALLAVGVVLAVLGARQGAGELLIAGAAVVSVFGMIFLVPVVVVGVARLGRRLPAAAAVRRTRCGAAPHPHRPGRRRRRRDRGRCRRAVDREHQRPGTGQGGVLAPAAPRLQLDRDEQRAHRLGRGRGRCRPRGSGGTGQPRGRRTRLTRHPRPGRARAVELPDGFMSTLPVQALVSDGHAVPAAPAPGPADEAVAASRVRPAPRRGRAVRAEGRLGRERVAGHGRAGRVFDPGPGGRRGQPRHPADGDGHPVAARRAGAAPAGPDRRAAVDRDDAHDGRGRRPPAGARPASTRTPTSTPSAATRSPAASRSCSGSCSGWRPC